MKVIKYPKYKDVSCHHCMAVLRPKPKDIHKCLDGYCLVCPVCKRNNAFLLEDLMQINKLQPKDS